MSSILPWIFLLAIYHSILFYGKSLGMSVILFIIPLLGLIYNVLKTKNKIKDKRGLIFVIPIILLSLTYLIFNNLFFRIINIPVITVLFILMYIYMIKPTFKLNSIIISIISILFKPLTYISNIYHLVIENIKLKVKLSDKTKKVMKSVLIILPIVLIVLILLSTADQIFGSIFEKIFSSLEKLSFKKLITELIGRIIPITIIFFYIAATINFILYNYSKIKYSKAETKSSIDPFTIKLLLTILNIIYLIFDIIQIRSLMLHQVSMDISYAEYARQGFFQLMFVSLINIIVILVSKKVENKIDQKTNNYLKVMNLIMVFLTFIIIVSAFIRMHMYECEFGYTLLRLLVYVSLISEVFLLIPTIIYILNSKFNIVKSYMVILVSIYTVINFINVDYIIAYKNINRYYDKNDLDIIYLENNGTDNIPLLVDLYHKTADPKLKKEIKTYLTEISITTNNLQEYNISKANAIKEIETIKDEE